MTQGTMDLSCLSDVLQNGATCAEVSDNFDLDENLYSRSLYVFGKSAMKSVTLSNIFIGGLGGLGAEVAKNVVLGGVRTLMLHDPRPVTLGDLGTSLFLKEDDVGKKREDVTAQCLRELNPYVTVKALGCQQVKLGHQGLDEEILREYQVVIFTEGFQSAHQTEKLADFCHREKIFFILCETRGLFGRMFCDFGPSFTVQSPKWDIPTPILVQQIFQDGPAQVHVTCAAHHGLGEGDLVRFFENGVQGGLGELGQGGRNWPIRLRGPKDFSIEGVRDPPTSVPPGTHVTRVDEPVSISFEKLSVSIQLPRPKVSGVEEEGDFKILKIHALFRALDKFIEERERLPFAFDEADFELFCQFVSNFLPENPTDECLKKVFFNGCHGNLCPTNAVIGGFVGQEVMKACSGKFMPLDQWFFFDASDCLSLMESLGSSPRSSENVVSRYEGQVTVFGSEFQKALGECKVFVVGAGAIGCELLKNFALMGVGCGPGGQVIVTDMDGIEKSNLNRQVLFRSKDVGKSKSETAAIAIKNMNSTMTIKAYMTAVGPETGEFYDDHFYGNLDCIASAVDNIGARNYLNEMAIRNHTPLLDSATNGTMGNTQVVIPGLTRDYVGPSSAAMETFPICTLKYFPNAIHHTLQWGREKFEELFKLPAEIALAYGKEGASIWSQEGLPLHDRFGQVSQLKRFLDQKPTTFTDCVYWARVKLDEFFNFEIRQLLEIFPPDAIDTQGQPFWVAHKICPVPYDDLVSRQAPCHDDDGLRCHDNGLNFVIHAANLMAQVFGIEKNLDRNNVQLILSTFNFPQDAPRPPTRGLSAAQIMEAAEMNDEVPLEVDEAEILRLESTLPSPGEVGQLKLFPLTFEKDDDTNSHVDFITAASNLRALNYSIPPVDRLTAKRIVGRIIPAIATTTSVVAALVAFELYKLVQLKLLRAKKEGVQEADELAGKLSMKIFKNASLNLATPNLWMTRIIKPRVKRYNGKEFDVWSRFEVQGDLTLRQFLDHFKKNHDLVITDILDGRSILFRHSKNEEAMKNNEIKMDLRISELCQSKSRGFLWLSIYCQNSTELPPVRYSMMPSSD